MNETLGRLLVITGITIVIAGLLFIYKDSVRFVRQIGRLPGDIHVKKDGFIFYFPVTTCIVISIVASLVLFMLNRLK